MLRLRKGNGHGGDFGGHLVDRLYCCMVGSVNDFENVFQRGKYSGVLR